MEVTEFVPSERLTLTSRPAPMRLELCLTAKPVAEGTELAYREEVLEFGTLLGLAGLVLLPIATALLLVLLPFRPIFRWSLRRRLRRVEVSASQA